MEMCVSNVLFQEVTLKDQLSIFDPPCHLHLSEPPERCPENQTLSVVSCYLWKLLPKEKHLSTNQQHSENKCKKVHTSSPMLS